MSVGTVQGRLRAVAPAAGRDARAWARPEVAALGALVALAAVVRFWGIGQQGFWFDEGNTALLVHLSLGKMLGLLPQSESTPPLYYCVAWVWARLFGFSEAGLRSLSALVGVLVVPVVFAGARRLAGTRVALIAAALTACDPILVWYSQEARAYELLVLLSAGTLVAALRAREHPTGRRLGAWAVICALALATHYYAVLVVVPEAVWLLWSTWREPARRPAVASVAGIVVWGLILLPLALHQEHAGYSKWIALEPLSRRLGQVIPQFLVGFQMPARGVLAPLAVVLAGLGLGAGLAVGVRGGVGRRRGSGAGSERGRGVAGGAGDEVGGGAGDDVGAAVALRPGEFRGRRAVTWAGGIALAGLVINLLIVAGGVDDLLTRNLLALWPAAALALAAGLGARRLGVAGLVVTGVLCALGLTTVGAVASTRAFQRPDWRGVARLLGPAPADGTRAILIQHYLDLLPLSLQEPHLARMGASGASVRELDVIAFTAPTGPGYCWWGAACNLSGSRVQSAYALPGFRPLWRRSYHQFTVVRLVAARPTPVTRAEVARALTSTHLSADELLVQR